MIKVEIETEVSISGYFYPEEKERGPSYSSGGEPGVPAHWEDVELVIHGQSITPEGQLKDWCIEQLNEGLNNE